MHGLESARGFIQSKIAERLQTKNTPIIRFVLDPSVKKSIEVSRALQEAHQIDAAAANPGGLDTSEASLDDDDDDVESNDDLDDVSEETPSDDPVKV